MRTTIGRLERQGCSVEAADSDTSDTTVRLPCSTLTGEALELVNELEDLLLEVLDTLDPLPIRRNGRG